MIKYPQTGEYIDIHTHDARSAANAFILENLMAHEGRSPGDAPEQVCSFGIHPWFLNEENYGRLLDSVKEATLFSNLIAIGECGFDKLRGPSMELQRKAFEEQVSVAEAIGKPVVIHCVKAWDELLPEYKKLRPEMPWFVHGFRGNSYLAAQLLSKGMYLSFWYDFVIRPEAAPLLQSLPKERIFLETDSADIDIRDIYKKVASDLSLTVDELKSIIVENFRRFFKVKESR